MKGVIWVLLLILVGDVQASSSIPDYDDNTASQLQSAQGLTGDTEGKWLPVPIPMSNPTVGTGLQFALLYLHPAKGEQTKKNPTSGLGAVYTDNKSWLVGAFHSNYFADDKYRFTGFTGYADLNLDFFGVGGSLTEQGVGYNIKTTTLYAQTLLRLTDAKDWFVGVRYFGMDADLSIARLRERFPDLPSRTFDSVNSSLGLVVKHDSVDDSYYPTKGSVFEANWMHFSEALGGDFEFDRHKLEYKSFTSIQENHVLAVRGVLKNVEGAAPFYLLSNLNMRGFPAGRYLDDASLSLHAEWRAKWKSRWGSIVFVETGWVADSISEMGKSENITSYGMGLRWQPIKTKTLNLGLDLALSQGESAVYVKIGESY